MEKEEFLIKKVEAMESRLESHVTKIETRLDQIVSLMQQVASLQEKEARNSEDIKDLREDLKDAMTTFTVNIERLYTKIENNDRELSLQKRSFDLEHKKEVEKIEDKIKEFKHQCEMRQTATELDISTWKNRAIGIWLAASLFFVAAQGVGMFLLNGLKDDYIKFKDTVEGNSNRNWSQQQDIDILKKDHEGLFTKGGSYVKPHSNNRN